MGDRGPRQPAYPLALPTSAPLITHARAPQNWDVRAVACPPGCHSGDVMVWVLTVPQKSQSSLCCYAKVEALQEGEPGGSLGTHP